MSEPTYRRRAPLPDRFLPKRVDGREEGARLRVLIALLVGFCLGLVAGAALDYFTL